MSYRISADVGGTFTDLTVADGDTLIGRYKSPTTPQDLTRGVYGCLELAAADVGESIDEFLANTDVFVHGSTTATNAILEGKGVKTGLICTKGTKYTLWKGEGRRQDVFNFKRRNPQPLLRPYLCLEVTERIDKHGNIVIPLDEEQVRDAVRQLRDWGVEAIAVCLLWSLVNPVHEKRIEEIVQEQWPGVACNLSHDIQPIVREYHRMSCVVLNSMVQPIVTAYLEKLRSDLKKSGFSGDIFITISDGGVVPIEEVIRRPVFMVFSGPATGPVAGKYYGEIDGVSNLLIVDMGGTSFDISTVIDGNITTARDGRILGYPLGVSSTEILTLGAGGGSIAWIDSGGMLMVGPESAGSEPGPVCYGRGGERPTVTDAYAALGFLQSEYFLGGRSKLDRYGARSSIRDQIADPLGLTVEAAAVGICEIANEKMSNGILDMTVRRGIDPREMTAVTGGGATCLAVARLARHLGIARVLIPRETSELCAFGGLAADIVLGSVASVYTTSDEFDYAGVNQAIAQLEARGTAFLDRLHASNDERKLEFYTAARYPHQVTELEVALDSAHLDGTEVANLVGRFHDRHHARYKTADTASSVEFVLWRSVARKLNPRVALQLQSLQSESAEAALLARHSVYFVEIGEVTETPFYDGERLMNGMVVAGPAVVVLADTTIVVPPEFELVPQEHSHFIMNVPG